MTICSFMWLPIELAVSGSDYAALFAVSPRYLTDSLHPPHDSNTSAWQVQRELPRLVQASKLLV